MKTRGLILIALWTLALPALADWRHGEAVAGLRTYYMRRGFQAGNVQKTWAAGGYFEGRTGEWNRLRAGFGLFTTLKLQGKRFEDGAALLRTGQRGDFLLGIANLQYHWQQSSLVLYRQRLSTPFFVSDPMPNAKMIPKLYEAATIDYNQLPNLRLFGSYVFGKRDEYMPTFKSISYNAGYTNVRKNVLVGGLNWTPQEKLTLQAWDYHMPDFFNLVYGQADAEVWQTDAVTVSAAAQAAVQKSGGRAYAGVFSTGFWGGKLSAAFTNGLTLTGAYTAAGRGRDVFTTWGDYPGFCSIEVEDNDRAGEKTWLVGLGYDFTRVGLKNLRATYTHTSSTTPKNVARPIPAQREDDIRIDWQGWGRLERLSWVFKAARVDQEQDFGGNDVHEVRTGLNYELPVKW